MPSRTYAQIDCSLTGSKKLRGLSSHKTRWAYLCAHLSDFATYTGLFQYPRHMWAHDAQLSPDELDEAITELVETGLLQFDQEEDFVRIVGWFHKRSGPDNRNRAFSVMMDLWGLESLPAEMLCSAAAELAVASIKRSLKWKPESGDREKLYDDLQSFLAELFQSHDERFLSCLAAEMQTSSSTVAKEIGAIFPPVMLLREEPFRNPSETLAKHETRRDEDETKTKRNEKKDETPVGEVHSDNRTTEPIQISEMLRRAGMPSPSALQSDLAQKARAGG